jgi:hypothetical protein
MESSQLNLFPANETPTSSGAAAAQGTAPDRHSAILTFLTALFGGKPADLFILVWLLSDKASHWFQDLGRAAEFVASRADQDVYCGVALSPADFGPHRRCDASATAGIVGCWADLDFRSGAHKKQNLPPDLYSAMSLIPGDLPPSIILNSGHGLQVWWLFKAPWIFKDDTDRERAAGLVLRFQALIKAGAAARGWEIDSVHDLARVLRIEGTTNTKIADDPKLVTRIWSTAERYTPAWLSEYLDRAGAIAPRHASIPTSDKGSRTFVLDPEAEPPFDKFEALKEVDPDFERAWEHKLRLNDNSASGFDLSLATRMAFANFTDQDIVDVLIACRRKHGDDLKLRADYFERTIAKARAAATEYWERRNALDTLNALTAGQDGDTVQASTGTRFRGGPAEAAEQLSLELSEPGEDVEYSDTQAPDQEVQAENRKRKVAVESVSKMLGVQIQRVVKFKGEPAQYRLEMPGGAAVQLGNVDGLISQSKLRRAIADTTRKYIPHFDGKDWVQIAQGLLSALEEEDRGPEVTLHGALTANLVAYLNERVVLPKIEDAYKNSGPFLREGRVFIFVDDFITWLSTRRNERVWKNKLTADLRAYRAVPVTVPLKIDGRETTRSAWQLPDGLWDEVPGVADSCCLI